MQSSRVRIAFAAACAVAAVATGCSGGDDAVITSDLGPGQVIDDDTVSDQAADAAVDESALRTGSDANNSSRVGADAAGTIERPTPPTLSSDGAATLVTSTPAAPVTSTTVATTAAQVTTSASTTTSAAPTTTAQGETSSTTGSAGTETTVPATSSTVSLVLADLDSGESYSFSLLNQLRSSLSLTDLATDGDMAAFARDWSGQMAASGSLEHSSGPYGENIAFTSNTGLTSAEAADLFHQLWMDSPGHLDNMTNGSYTKTGVGLYLTEKGWYGTHVFSF